MDGNNERQVHRGFVGRAPVLAELDRLLVGDGVDRRVMLTGERGTGKTAILASWLARREALHELVPHYFVRRQQSDRVEPAIVVCALAAQIEERYPALRDLYARPEARLTELLDRVSARELVPRAGRMVLVVDGLDDGHPASDVREVLAFLPRALPRGVRVLVAGRHRDPRRSSFEDRHGRLIRLDLDDPSLADDNEATVRAFWRHEALGLALDDSFVERAVRCSGGNMLHATALRVHLASVPYAQQRSEAIPRGLAALLALLWQRLAGDPAAVRALGILCAAREPLSLEQLGRVAGWSDVGDQRAVMYVARELVVEVRRAGRTVYRLFHDAVRSHVVEQLGPIAMRGHHQELADKLAIWPAPRDAAARRYALQYAIGHRIAAGNCHAIHGLASNLDFLEAKCNELGVDDVELSVRRAGEACLTAGELMLAGALDELARAIARDSIALRHDTGGRAAQVWKRLRQSERRVDAIELRAARPGGDGAAASGRARLGRMSRRALAGCEGAVRSCAVTLDGRRVIAASADHSLKIWDLDSGRLLSTLTGHTDAVASCAVTLDGRRLVSASADTTLKVWDLDTGRVLATLEGHTDMVERCAIIPDGRRVVSASADKTLRIWDLETGNAIAALEAHAAAVTDCTVTPDGRHVVSASADTTLKVWDLETGSVITTLAGHTAEVASCAVTPDGRRVVSGSSDHTLKVWDVETGSVISTLVGHTGRVASCNVAADGRLLYSGSHDATLKIWDLDTGCVVATLESRAGPVLCCAVTPDSRRLVFGTFDPTLNVWEVEGSLAPTLHGRSGALSGSTASSSTDGTGARRARRPRASKHMILFLAANPKDTSSLVLDKECAAIERELQMAPHGDDFEFRSKWAVTIDEMARHLLVFEPTIIHFSGHGRSSGPETALARDVRTSDDSGIYLNNEQGGTQLVTGRALGLLVKASSPSARVVVLNACYSDGQAEALCQVVECVVGMARAIHDHAALSFAVAFYRALGHRRSVGNAVEQAVAMLAARYLPDEGVPRCRTNNWVDAGQIFL